MRATADTIPVALDGRERHVLAHLLSTYIRLRIEEGVTYAKNPAELREGAEGARLLAQLEGLARGEGTLPREDAEVQRDYLVKWAGECDATTHEHEEWMTDELELPSRRSGGRGSPMSVRGVRR
jgi:hypothetical protein